MLNYRIVEKKTYIKSWDHALQNVAKYIYSQPKMCI